MSANNIYVDPLGNVKENTTGLDFEYNTKNRMGKVKTLNQRYKNSIEKINLANIDLTISSISLGISVIIFLIMLKSVTKNN
tara:strand:- start:1100 stop:1342 length:243 start_codon:yes stop_codon:yes gene_type:complete